MGNENFLSSRHLLYIRNSQLVCINKTKKWVAQTSTIIVTVDIPLVVHLYRKIWFSSTHLLNLTLLCMPETLKDATNLVKHKKLT